MKYTTYFMFEKPNYVSLSGGKYYIVIPDKMLKQYMGLILSFMYGTHNEGTGLENINK